MSGGNSDDDPLEAILRAQNSMWDSTLPRLVQRPALAPLAPKTTPSLLLRNESADSSRPATSFESRPPTNQIGFPRLPKLPLPAPMESISEKPTTPLYPIPRVSYNLNLNDIDDDEILRPDSATSSVLESRRDVVRRELRLPETFSEFRELSVELDLVSSEDIDRMRQAARSHDHSNSGFVTLPAVLSSIKSVLQNPSDTWQNLLDWLMASRMEEEEEVEEKTLQFVLEYELFFEMLHSDKQAREVLTSIPEVLESDERGSIISHLPSRPTSRQEQRERWRAELLVDMRKILDANPEIDIERFKSSTEKKVISVDELKMLLQIYGLTDHLEHLEQRIIDCFLTQDHFFCFSAFVGCLNQLNPPPPATSSSSSCSRLKLDDSGVIADFASNGSH